MKILVVSHAYAPEVGAAPSRITNMAEALHAHGAEVDILTCLPNYPKGEIFDGYKGCFSQKEVINGVNVFRYWTYASISSRAIDRILSMMAFSITLWVFAFRIRRIRHYDRVIIQSPHLAIAASALVLFRKIYRRTCILNVSDLWPLSAVELGAVKEGSKMHKFMLWIERFIYKNASAFQGQSNEIIEHIRKFQPDKRCFLYRNLQHDCEVECVKSTMNGPFKFVYAGLMGVAQNILALVKNIDFRRYNAELHLYGGGNQAAEIQQYVKTHDCAVVYHGILEKSAMVKELSMYQASIVPLAVRIQGAVPSKIFDLLPVGIPILFCGGGEGARIVEDYNLGFVSEPADLQALERNIKSITTMDKNKYQTIRESCLAAAKNDFSFEVQMRKYYHFLVDLD